MGERAAARDFWQIKKDVERLRRGGVNPLDAALLRARLLEELVKVVEAEHVRYVTLLARWRKEQRCDE